MVELAPNINLVFQQPYRDFYQFTLACIRFYSDRLEKQNRLTERETEVMAILVIFQHLSRDPFSEPHMEAYENLFGRIMDRNAIRGYLRKMEAKFWLSVDIKPGTDSLYGVPKVFSPWHKNERNFSVTAEFIWNGEEG